MTDNNHRHQTSPGVYVNTPGQPLQGIASNISIKGAQAQGMLPSSIQVATINGVAVSKSFANPTVSHLIAAGVLDPATGVGARLYRWRPAYGGD